MIYLLGSIKKIVRDGEFCSLFDEFSWKVNTLQWKRKYQEFNEYYMNRQWQEAIEAAEREHFENTEDSRFQRKLAHAYKKTKKMDQATEAMKRALSLRSSVDVETLIQQIEEASFCKADKVRSTYLYLGGANNLGFIHHVEEGALGTCEYVTKIIPTDYPDDHFAYKERYFHRNVLKNMPDLRAVVPEMIRSLENKEDQLLFMTFQKVSADPIHRKQVPELIQLQQKITQAIPYHDVKEWLELTDQGKGEQLSGLMHRPSTHRLLFQRMKNHSRKFQAYELERLINQFAAIVFDNRLYRHIDPTVNYVFCHRDFNEENIVYDQAQGRYYIIDWSSYGLGLRGLDAAKLLADAAFSFDEIESEYMPMIFDREEDGMLEHIFFAYLLVIEWMNYLEQAELEDRLNQCIRPAIQYIEEQTKQLEERE